MNNDPKSHPLFNKNFTWHLIVDLASSLTESDLFLALAGIAGNPDRHMALAEIVRYPPENRLPEVIVTLRRANPIAYHWVKAVALLLPRLSAEQQSDLIAEMLSELGKFELYYYARADAMAEMVPHLPPKTQVDVLAAARIVASEIRDAGLRRKILAKLAIAALAIDSDKRPLARADVWQAVSELADSYRPIVLREMAPHFSGPDREVLIDEGLAAARLISEEYARARALMDLSWYLPSSRRPPVWEESLLAARGGQDPDRRATALVTLSEALPNTHRHAVLLEALTAVRQIQDPHRRASALLEMRFSLAPII